MAHYSKGNITHKKAAHTCRLKPKLLPSAAQPQHTKYPGLNAADDIKTHTLQSKQVQVSASLVIQCLQFLLLSSEAPLDKFIHADLIRRRGRGRVVILQQVFQLCLKLAILLKIETA